MLLRQPIRNSAVSFYQSVIINVAFKNNPNLLNPCSFSELTDDTEVAESSGDFHIKTWEKIRK